MPFVFRLQSLLDLQLREERDLAGRLAEARAMYDAAQTVVARLVATDEAHRRTVQAPEGMPGHHHVIALVRASFTTQLAAARDDATRAESLCARLEADLALAIQERRALELLREQHRAAFRADEDRRERLAMDEIARTRRLRQPSDAVLGGSAEGADGRAPDRGP